MPEYVPLEGAPTFADTVVEPGPTTVAPELAQDRQRPVAPGRVDLTQHPAVQAAGDLIPAGVRNALPTGAWPGGVQAFGDIPPERMDADIDIASGAPFTTRVLLERARNPEEAKKALASQYGPRDFGQDGKGRWWVMQNGRRTLVLPDDKTWGAAFGRVGADLAAAASPLAGMATGAVAGGSVGGLPGAAIGAGLGAMGGEALDNVAKWATGIFAQSPREVAGNLATQGAIGTIGEGLGPAARGAFNALKRHMWGATPEIQATTERLLELGFRPQYAQMIPGAKIIGMHEKFWNRVVGPWAETENRELLVGQFSRALQQAGITDAEVKAAMARSRLGEHVTDASQLGEAIGHRYATEAAGMRGEIDLLQNQANQILSNAEKVRRRWGEARSNDLGDLFAEGVGQARSDFSKAMNSQYAKWTELTGAAPVVEADGPVLAARHIADAHGWQIIRNPETFEYRLAPKYEGVQIPQLPSVIEQLATRDVGQGLSITDAHNLRVKLHEQMRGMAGAGNMTPGPKWHELRQVDNALNSSFSALENESGPMGQAARGLAATNKQYAEGIRQFSSDLIRKVAGDAAQGRPANPEVIADVLLSEGRNAQTRQILRLLPDETKKEVRRAYMNGMFREADILDPVTGERVFSGSSLLRGLDADRREAMRAAGFSEREISGLRRFAQWAHANKITMNAEEMAALERATAAVGPTEPGKIQDILKSIIGRKLVYRRFVESDPTSAVLNMSNPQLRDEVVNYLIVPGKTARLEEAARVLGTNSPEWQEIQRVATLKLLQGVMDETTAGTPKIIADRLQSNLNAFTPKQKELLFPNHLDDDLIRLMRDTRFMFPEGRKTEFGVSLAAASVLLHAGLPFSSHAIKADIAVGTSLLASWIMTRQPLMRFLALESSQNPTVARNLSAALRMMALEDMTAGPGRRRAARPDLWNLPPDRHE